VTTLPPAPTREHRLRSPATGLVLAAALVAGWLALHLAGVFLFAWHWPLVLLAPLMIALQCWLSVGLFIVAHDAMHGSLAPGRPGVNRWLGRLCLLLYAGFWFDDLLDKHQAHHRAPGGPEDPDFAPDHPRRFGPWFLRFARSYFGWREFARLCLPVAVYLLLLDVAPANLLAFWAVPAWLSALQLFLFGTYLPHRHGAAAFADRHRARSSGYPVLLSLITCFHFGYHLEHHRDPGTPWWRLPASRRPTAQEGPR
jgi:beta-carotene ketolase (CrtW type)